MIRGAKPHAPHRGVWNGLGGTIEDEDRGDFEACARREVEEEAGIRLGRLDPVGTFDFYHRHILMRRVQVYRAYEFEGMPTTSGDEGDVRWWSMSPIRDIPTHYADQFFLEWVFRGKHFDMTHRILGTDGGVLEMTCRVDGLQEVRFMLLR